MQSPRLLWFRQLGFDDVRAHAITIDHLNHLYICGDRIAKSDNEEGQSSLFAYLVKYDGNGNLMWNKRLKSTDEMRALAIINDSSGNIFICGEIYKSEKENFRQKNIAFVAKYNQEGSEIWTQQMDSIGRGTAQAITNDQSGNIFICGSNQLKINGEKSKIEKYVSKAFFVKFDSRGKQKLFHQIDLRGNADAMSICTDHKGQLLISGSSGIDSDRPGDQNLKDGYVAKYDTEGNQLWLMQPAVIERNLETYIAVDQQDNVFMICGNTRSSQKDHEVFVLTKYDTDGKQLWFRTINSIGEDPPSAIKIDQRGNVLINGVSFLAKYDTVGNPLWTSKYELQHYVHARAITTDELSNIYISGYVHIERGVDAFILKYSDPSENGHLKLIESKIDKISTEFSKLKYGEIPNELNLVLIQLANDLTRPKGKGHLSKSEARKIINKAQDARGRINEAKKKTLAYIYAKYLLTQGAKELIVNALARK